MPEINRGRNVNRVHRTKLPFISYDITSRQKSIKNCPSLKTISQRLYNRDKNNMIKTRFGKIFINPDYVFVKRSINAYSLFGQLYNPVTVDRIGSASRIDIADAMPLQ